ncbi:LysR family transcriptional regulator [Stakelama sediminis]
MQFMQHGPLKLKAQLYCGEEIAMGPGKADLLDAIDREGSISAAARAMGMSYRRGWMLVDSMNRCWTEKLVETAAGRSGAQLTPCGKAVLTHYRALQRAMAELTGHADYAALAHLLRDHPAIKE